MGGDGWGGVERWLMDISRGLAARGHSVAMAGRPGSQWMQRSRDRGFDGVEVSLRSDFHLGQARTLSRFMTERGVDVVLTKLHRGIRAAGFAAKLAGAPPVVAFMGLVETRPGLRYRLTYELFLDRVVTLSERMRTEIVERGDLDPAHVEVIPYGVILENFVSEKGAREAVRDAVGVPYDAPFALALGRLNHQKRFDRMIDAFAQVRRDVPDAHLVIGGAGKLEGELREQVERLSLTDCVHVLGFRRDVARLLAAADCLTLSSDDEGLPMVILEAMACRKPVVSMSVGSIDELVVPGETGLLVPPGDTDGLAAALTAVLSDPERAARMGEAAYERVSTLFPLERCIDRTEAYLLSVRRR